MFERFRRWLSGSFTCRSCGREVHAMTFGYGTTICLDCYEGEQPLLFLNEGYWLNRLLLRLTRLPREGRY